MMIVPEKKEVVARPGETFKHPPVYLSPKVDFP
jgi:hypothetical protein